MRDRRTKAELASILQDRLIEINNLNLSYNGKCRRITELEHTVASERDIFNKKIAEYDSRIAGVERLTELLESMKKKAEAAATAWKRVAYQYSGQVVGLLGEVERLRELHENKVGGDRPQMEARPLLEASTIVAPRR